MHKLPNATRGRLELLLRGSDARLRSDGAATINVDIARLCSLAEAKRQQCGARRWKFTFRGREIVLHDTSDKLIAWLDRFKQLGNITVSFNPQRAALPWAGVRIFLDVRSSSSVINMPFLPNVCVGGRDKSHAGADSIRFRQVTLADNEQMGALLVSVEKATLIIANDEISEALYPCNPAYHNALEKLECSDVCQYTVVL
jgi:hypothetical protein